MAGTGGIRREDKSGGVFTRRALLLGAGQLGIFGALAAKLYQVQVAGRTQVWCVLDNRKLRALSAPSLTVPLLTAYGVAAPLADQ